MQHYFTDQILSNDTEFEVSADIAHHFMGVLRSTEGNRFEIVDGNHQLFVAELTDNENNLAKVVEASDKDVELPANAVIICGLPKKEKAELVVQKATELGVKKIIFTPTDWAIAKWNNKAEKKLQRFRKIARSAAEQSHRNVIPEVEYINSIKELANYDFDHRLIAYEESAKHGEKSDLIKTLDQTKPGESVAMFFGPEGGISPKEVETLQSMGYLTCGLGPRILRTETAPFYFLSALSVHMELNSLN
ncbi:Ribosomal RNA small subunit methyltransferase E [Apilactobacillus kunkeei]|uniref:16S rRNA (uracil(1498)-N(3))-methyltransferase n=1 Tax=Apilactobacillus kunkeei TaxID=148814 RepID=UPI0006B248E5|nr:16S rRNA (uracil(1498)-N(3))-methyltransferase [Apilactobacillus kunkeei]KOY77991.1 Ribosomal RNA small subunit methyltransferase E [Apilactobacillus kunkeei]